MYSEINTVSGSLARARLETILYFINKSVTLSQTSIFGPRLEAGASLMAYFMWCVALNEKLET